jgi:hypothetical protein
VAVLYVRTMDPDTTRTRVKVGLSSLHWRVPLESEKWRADQMSQHCVWFERVDPGMPGKSTDWHVVMMG